MKERKNWEKQKEVCLYVLGVVCLLYFVLSVVVVMLAAVFLAQRMP